MGVLRPNDARRCTIHFVHFGCPLFFFQSNNLLFMTCVLLRVKVKRQFLSSLLPPQGWPSTLPTHETATWLVDLRNPLAS